MFEKKYVIIGVIFVMAAIMIGAWTMSEDFEVWLERGRMKIIEMSNNPHAEK